MITRMIKFGTAHFRPISKDEKRKVIDRFIVQFVSATDKTCDLVIVSERVLTGFSGGWLFKDISTSNKWWEKACETPLGNRFPISVCQRAEALK